MAWKPCDFDRRQYLTDAAGFEGKIISDVGSELCEFNEDAEALAVELSYCRYRIAKLEQFIRNGVEYGYIRVPDWPDPGWFTVEDIMNL